MQWRKVLCLYLLILNIQADKINLSEYVQKNEQIRTPLLFLAAALGEEGGVAIYAEI